MSAEQVLRNAPWTKGPWQVGPSPAGHCRIYADCETHAIAKTYSPELNAVGVCELAGPKNAADAKLISLAPKMAVALIWLEFARCAMHENPQTNLLHEALDLCAEVADELFEMLDTSTATKEEIQ